MSKNIESLAQRLRDDAAEHAKRQAERAAERNREHSTKLEFDPYQTTRWWAVAGADPGYMPKNPMRHGPVGFHIHCKGCNGEFESKGWGYCATCMALPAEERHAMRPAVIGRICQAPGCENPIPRAARAGTMYCSKPCRQRASYSTHNAKQAIGS